MHPSGDRKRFLIGGTLVGSVAYPEKDITTRLNFNPGDKIRFEETTGLCGIFSVETTNKRPALPRCYPSVQRWVGSTFYTKDGMVSRYVMFVVCWLRFF